MSDANKSSADLKAKRHFLFNRTAKGLVELVELTIGSLSVGEKPQDDPVIKELSGLLIASLSGICMSDLSLVLHAKDGQEIGEELYGGPPPDDT